MSRMIAYWRLPLAVAAGLLLAAGLATAQETPKAASPPSEAAIKPASAYRLDYVVRELEDGKRINSRSYSLSMRAQQQGTDKLVVAAASLRIGGKVPYATGAGPGPGPGNEGFQYQDVGINIDSHLNERDYNIELYTKFELSSMVRLEKPTQDPGNPVPNAPVVRVVQLSIDSHIIPGKPTVIAAMDDVATNRRYEIEVTVTKMK